MRKVQVTTAKAHYSFIVTSIGVGIEGLHLYKGDLKVAVFAPGHWLEFIDLGPADEE
jgi:hypothetical protein